MTSPIRVQSVHEDTLQIGYDRIKATFNFFNENGRKLEALCAKTKNIYERIETELKGVSFQKSLTSYLLLEGEVKNIKQLKNNPSLIFVGQTKAGKSSLINELLGKYLVTSDQRPCTARLVRLTHGEREKPRITILNADGTVHTAIEEIETSYIPGDLVNLPFEDRDKEEVVQTSVRVEVNHPLLAAGVDIIDSPGRNENKTLDNLVTKQMDSILPLVLYVIDGRNCLTNPDIQDIQAIIEKTSSCENVFFVINKIDPPRRCSSFSDSDSDVTDSDSEEEEDELERERFIKDKIFKRLVVKKFINKKYENKMDECPNFHALSSWEVKRYRRSYASEPATAVRTRYVDKFERFQKCLNEHIKDRLEEKIKIALDGILMSHGRCLNFFVDTANNLSKKQCKRHSCANDLDDFQKREEELYRNCTALINQKTQSFGAILHERMVQQNDDIIRAVGQYDLWAVIPENVNIKDKEYCRNILIVETQRQLSNVITEFIVDQFGTQDQLMAELASRVKALGDDEGYCGAAKVLGNTLIRSYQLNLVGREFTKTFFQRLLNAIKRLYGKLKTMFSLKEVAALVNEQNWKEQVALTALKAVNMDELTQLALEGVDNHVTTGHETFCKEIINLKQIYESGCKMNEEERKKLTKQAPAVARLQLDGFDMKDRFQYPQIHIDQSDIIGIGIQGVVYGTSMRGQRGDECVVKVRKCRVPNALDELALEIHYTRQFKHENIMPLYASLVQYDKMDLYLISPRMEGDLTQMLPKIGSLKDRLGIALQTANALSYLHQLDMSHRDIKASNILIERQQTMGYKALITDFGFTKPIGLQQLSFVGTPIHVAPEIIERKLYDTSVDIFSFGILLWYICEGSGTRQPKYADYCDGLGPVLNRAAALGKRPERKDFFTDECWNLMSKCWNQNPICRPKADEVVKELVAISAKLQS